MQEVGLSFFSLADSNNLFIYCLSTLNSFAAEEVT